MNKISFKKEEKTDSLFIFIHSKESLSFNSSKNKANVRFHHDLVKELAIIKINLFFTDYLRKQDLKIVLAQLRIPDFIIGYDAQEDTLTFSYEKTKDLPEFNFQQGYYLYATGKETIMQINVNNFSDYLSDEKIKHRFFTKKTLIEKGEEKIISYYVTILKRYEEDFKENEKIRKAKSFLEHIKSNFPITCEDYIGAIEEQLKDFKSPELQECIINIKEMQRKEIRLEPLEEESKKDEAEECIDQYGYSRGNLTRTFDDDQIERVPLLAQQKLQEARQKIGRVRRILEVRYKSAKPENKIKIEKYITLIKRFEVKTYYVNKEEERRTLDNILNILDGISVLIVGIPKAVIESIVKVVRAVKSLVDLIEDYKKEKDEGEERERNKEKEEQDDYQEETYTPSIPERTLRRQREPVYVRGRFMNTQKVQQVISKYGPKTVPSILSLAAGYNYFLDKEQVYSAVQSYRFKVLGETYLQGRGRRRYNIYGLTRR